jgi:beta-glucosidase
MVLQYNFFKINFIQAKPIRMFRQNTVLLFFVITFYCCSPPPNSDLHGNFQDSLMPVEQRVELLLKEMTLEEKIGQMCQYVGEAAKINNNNADEIIGYKLATKDKADLIIKGLAGSFLKVPGYREANYLQEIAMNSRLKIPLLIATDAIHGHGMDMEASTIFPSPISIASSFDIEVAEKIAYYTAKEMRSTGFHWTFSPNIDVVRDPRWGRTGETFGEDTYLVSELGVAMIRGYQGKNFSENNNVIACAKHLVAGGIPNNGLNGAPADVSERTLQEVFYPPFIKAIEAGVYTVMPAHNEVNGIPCHGDHQLLTILLKDKWNFKGFIISDWNDIARLHSVHKVAETRKEADRIAVLAGVDMHMHGSEFLENIKTLVQEGKIPVERINEAVKKILRAKFQLGLFEYRFTEDSKIKETILNKEHTEFALEAARRSIVLLRNNQQTLPLDSNVHSIFITGPNANDQSMLGDWARIQPEGNVITVLGGIKKNISGSTKLDYLACGEIDNIKESVIKEASARAKKSDLAIVVVGENSLRENANRTSGENLDKASLELPGRQLELIKAIAKSGKPVIVVFINGGPISSEWCADSAHALIEAWEPGMMGGQAVADVIFGRYNPSGKLPITFPRSSGHSQNFYNYKPSAFHRGKFKFSKTEPLYEFGYGLSYTNFEYRNLVVPEIITKTQDLKIQVEIENTGKIAGEEIVLVFIDDIYSSVTTPVKELKAFKRIFLNAGEKRTVEFTIQSEKLSLFDINMKKVVEPGTFEVIIGLDRIKKKFLIK